MKQIKTAMDPIRALELMGEIMNNPNTPHKNFMEFRHIMYDRRNEKMLLEFPIGKFFQALHISYMFPQKYGFLIQARVKKDFSYSSARNKDAGDASKDGKDKETKASIITETNKSINLRQARQWQKCEYDIVAVDVKTLSEPVIYLFKLTHSDMEQELSLCKAGKSHIRGQEKSITIKVDKNDENFNRWCKNYRVKSPWDDELNKK